MSLRLLALIVRLRISESTAMCVKYDSVTKLTQEAKEQKRTGVELGKLSSKQLEK